ncbi:MAG: MBL fold metallo-hydrolase [Lachnospiraceae bacterium]|nr:MBL fold metallo-hydrolase [Lachnospiraceae bacterium]
MRICSIASGSSGNCIYIGNTSTHILVDVGISGKKCEEGLRTLDLTGKDINAILVTHEHSDHIAGLGVMARKYGIPIYATKLTLDAVKNTSCVKNVSEELLVPIVSDKSFYINDILVDPMKVSHDAVDPVAYRFEYNGKKACVCTDLGEYTDYTVNALKGMDTVLLEANHDVKMLQVGPYPYYLKQRILGRKGHLSNETSGRLLDAIAHDGLNNVILGHLSNSNNIPELAYEAVRLEVDMSPSPYRAKDFNLMVAKRSEPSKVLEIG